MSTSKQPPELARCDDHGLVLLPTKENPRPVRCIACEFDLEFRPDDSPGGGKTLNDHEFRGRLEWETVQELVPIMRAYLEDNEEGPLWVTHIPWKGTLPAGYTEQERFIPVLRYEWDMWQKTVVTNSEGVETITTLREAGYDNE